MTEKFMIYCKYCKSERIKLNWYDEEYPLEIKCENCKREEIIE